LSDGNDKHYSVENYRNNPKMLKYYTGFDDYNHLCYFLTVLFLLFQIWISNALCARASIPTVLDSHEV